MTLKQVAQAGLATGLLGILLFGGVASAGDVSRGALLAAHCETCHGTNGKGAMPMPPISGMDVADMVDIMKAFASKEESSTMMYRHAQGYTDEELKMMAEYLKGK